MTAIRGHIEPSAKGGALGIHSLDQFVLSVPDASVAEKFYSDFGLDVHRDGNGLALKTLGNAHRWGGVIEGARKRLHHLSFGCYAEDLPRLKTRIEGNGIKLVDPPPGLESNGFWFFGFDNILTEIKVANKRKSNGHRRCRARPGPPCASWPMWVNRAGSRTSSFSPQTSIRRSSSTRRTSA